MKLKIYINNFSLTFHHHYNYELIFAICHACKDHFSFRSKTKMLRRKMIINCFCILETGLNVVNFFVFIVIPLMVCINHKKNRITRIGITQDVTIIMAVASMKLFNDLLNIFVYFCVVEDIVSPIFDLEHKQIEHVKVDTHLVERMDIVGVLLIYKFVEYTSKKACFKSPEMIGNKNFLYEMQRLGFWELLNSFFQYLKLFLLYHIILLIFCHQHLLR